MGCLSSVKKEYILLSDHGSCLISVVLYLYCCPGQDCLRVSVQKKLINFVRTILCDWGLNLKLVLNLLQIFDCFYLSVDVPGAQSWVGTDTFFPWKCVQVCSPAVLASQNMYI